MEEAIRVVQIFVDNGDKREMSTQDKNEVLGHLDKIIEHDQRFRADEKHISPALKRATVSFGSFYRRLGHYHETKTLIEAVIGDEDVTPAEKIVLANMYCDHGELEKAEKLYTQVLTFFDKYLRQMADEKGDISILQFIYWTQDDKSKLDDLVPVGDFTKDPRQFMPWIVSLLCAYNGLGVLFMKRGCLVTAERLFKQALDGREKIGPDATATAMVVLHLGTLYTRNGHYDKAEHLLRRALESLKKLMGPDYILTQLASHNLGILRLQQNDLNGAEPLISRTTEFMKSTLGPIHAITLSAIHNQALLFRKQGKIDKAQKLLEKTIEGWKESGAGVAKPAANSKYDSDAKLEAESKYAGVAKSEADSKYCLAELYNLSSDKKDQAKRLFREAGELYSRALGEDHPQTNEAVERAHRCP